MDVPADASRLPAKIVPADAIPAPERALFEAWMRRAIGLARRANGRTHPNPLVGALIVEDGIVVAEGWHKRAGTPHAERNALAALGRPPRAGATLVVTLEPCSTHGRTGACTDAILAAGGISRIIVGATDPNPAHAGRGFEILRAAGISVVHGVLADDCARLNPIFNHWIVKKTPLFAAKIAMTLDGRTATRSGESQWITSAAARENVMLLRRAFPAVATGSGTVLADNPSLTARVPAEEIFCPERFVFDRRLRTLARLEKLKIFNDEFRGKTTLVTTPDALAAVPESVVARLDERCVRRLALNAEPTVFWKEFRAFCSANSLCGVLFEAGSALLGALLAARELDYLYAYIAPKIFGDPQARPAFAGTPLDRLADAFALEALHAEPFPPDIRLEARFAAPRD